MKKYKWYYIFLGLLLAVYVLIQMSRPQPFSWNKTFLKADKIPFGCDALYRLLENGLYPQAVQVMEKDIYTTTANAGDGPATYLFINDELQLTAPDLEALQQFTTKKNKVFMAANRFNGALADSFRLKTNIDFDYYFENRKDSVKHLYNFCNKKLAHPQGYEYGPEIPPVYFTSFDTAASTVLATDENKRPVFIKTQWQKGEFYFLCVPEVFGNYYLVNHPSRRFAYTALSFAQSKILCWDEYYKSYRKKVESPLQLVFSNDSLYAAYTLGLLSLLVFMLVSVKRRQKAIPIVKPLENTTLQFVEVVGTVYYKSGNHKNIAGEKITVLLEYLRNRFQVSTRYFDEKFYSRVAALSGIDVAELKILFTLIQHIERSPQISEQDLIALNAQIEKFHEKNKR